MGVVDSAWWGVWWPWMALWIAVLAALVACAWLVAVHRRRSRAGRDRIIRVCFYLHEQRVMDLYRVGRYQAALRREVEQRSRRGGSLSTGAPGVEAGVSRSELVFRRFIEEDEPITVIGTIMRALEKADVIVYADLEHRQVTDNRALRGRLAGGTTVRLHDLDDYVSVSGRFRKSGTTDTETVFLLPYGDVAGSGQPAHVRVVCDNAGFRTGDIPEVGFQARCLGLVLGWNPEAGELDVQPIAIFR